MNSELQKRLYEMEVMPPAAVWEKLSVNIDEINADNSIAKKVYGCNTYATRCCLGKYKYSY